jgi:hypothetical protein
MGKTMRAVLVGVGVLVVLWVLAHIAAYFDFERDCLRRYCAESPNCCVNCAESFKCCFQRLRPLGSSAQENCVRERTECEACTASAWRVLLP